MTRVAPGLSFFLLSCLAGACGDDTDGAGGAGGDGQGATTSATSTTTGTGSALCPNGVDAPPSPDPYLRSCADTPQGEGCCTVGGVYCLDDCGGDPACPRVLRACEGETYGAAMTLPACPGVLDDYRYTPCAGEPPCAGVASNTVFVAICYLGDWNPFIDG